MENKKKDGFDQKLCAKLEGCGKTQSTADPSENHSRHRLATALSFLRLSPTAYNEGFNMAASQQGQQLRTMHIHIYPSSDLSVTAETQKHHLK